MNISIHPEDSILKRHFNATVEMKRQIWLEMPPTDSILHRHAMSMGNQPATRSTTSVINDISSTSFNRSSSTVTTRQANGEKKGILAWFFDLFRSA
ncbi:MAG: hypothetical protein AB2806_13985 [Candidatus Thiodiazotropha sp.]